ncbi:MULTISPECIES: glycosyltransferase [unclassified Blastococcus]
MVRGNTPLVTVVTIAFNDFEGLRRTRRSLERQESDWRHIIMDGGSTDGSAEYVASLDDERTVAHSGPDKGRYDAMNRGSRDVNSELLIFMHAGDQFTDECVLSRAVESYQEHAWDWAFGLSRLVAHDGRVVGIAGAPPFSFRRFALGREIIPHQAAFFATNFFKLVGEYDLGFGLAADQLHFMRAATLSPPLLLGLPVCDFDLSGAGSTRRASSHYWDMSRARRRLGVRISPAASLDVAASLGLGIITDLRREIGRRRCSGATTRGGASDQS